MAKYNASAAASMESSGGGGFRLAKDNDKAKVVFLYAGPESIDGWACHKFTKPNGFTYTLDCPRAPKDPLEKCPACQAGEQLYTRIFVRMLNVDTGEVTIWDRASSFRKDLIGWMNYFNPLYKVVYEITRHGTGLDTKYQYQSLPGESGMTEEQYNEYVKQAEDKTVEFLRPIDTYLSVKNEVESAEKQAAEEGVNVQNNAAPAGAWGAPGQTPGWGAPNQNWGAAPGAPGAWGAPAQAQTPQNNAPAQAPAQGWGQAPAQNTTAPQGNAPAWGQAPQGWGQNGNGGNG